MGEAGFPQQTARYLYKSDKRVRARTATSAGGAPGDPCESPLLLLQSWLGYFEKTKPRRQAPARTGKVRKMPGRLLQVLGVDIMKAL